MRNIIHTILMLASAAAVLLSCNREIEQEVQDATDCVYRFELAEGETRATLGEDGVFWEVDKDNVGLYLGAAHGEAEVIQNGGTKYVQFTAPASASGKVYAYYPYQSANTSPASTKVVFPASQQGASVSAMPMAGVPFNVQSGDTNGKIHFLNLGAVIDFRVYSATYAGEQVQSIIFTATAGDHPACGEAMIDLTGISAANEESLAVSWSGSNPSSVTLSEVATTAATKEGAAAGHLYMVVAPGTYSGRITVITNAAVYTFPFENKTLTRNVIKRYNMDLDHAVRGATYSIENDNVAAFLNYEEEHPYDPDDYSYTHVMTYRNGTSETNRLDLPKPVPVTWTTSVSNPTVVIYNDPAHTDVEKMAFTENETSTSANVYNLAPGRTYYYVVKNSQQQVKAEGSFKTTGRRRMIKVGRNSAYGATHANNCRDLGGLPAMNGKTVKFGKLYRGTNMDATSDDQKDYLINKMGIRLDVDLRAKGNGSGGSTKAQTPALDVNTVYRTYDEEYDHWGNPSYDYNWNKALNNPNNMKKTLGYIFQYIHEGKAAYIHCKIGSDRTAYVCLLLEAILGVPQHLCDVDYELTSFSYSTDDHLPRRRDEDDISWYYYTRNGIPSILEQSGTTFQQKAINYVKAMGITEEQIVTFQNDMLENVEQ